MTDRFDFSHLKGHRLISEAPDSSSRTQKAALGQNRKPIFVDKSRIPEEMRNHPNVLEIESQVISQYANPEALERTCVHEAAHEIYLNRLGVVTGRRGPFAYLGEDPGECHFANAQVYAVDSSRIKNGLSIADWAKTFAAGSVAAKELTTLGAWEAANGIDGTGPGSDLNQFAEYLKLEINDVTDEQIKSTFEHAKCLVEIELRSPELRAEIWRVADDFGREIFGEGVLT